MPEHYRGGPVIAEVVRSGFVESRHHGSVVVLDAAGSVVAAVGDTTGPLFPRSSNKPLQAVGMLRAGLRPGSDDVLAITAASHRGERPHRDLVRRMLAGADLGEDRLRCPPAVPLGEVGGEPSRVGHNCSGKHAGMLLTCLAAGWPVDGYAEPGHPLQHAIRATVEDLAGERAAATGVDGCGAPVLALSLRAVAVAYLALFADHDGRAVADAMRAHPELVSGTGPAAHDTLLMRTFPGLLAKGGAEGVQAVAVPGVGVVVVKADDGARRALMPVLGWALAELGLAVVTPAEHVLGGGITVGTVRATL